MTDELRKKYHLQNSGDKCDLSKYEAMNKTGCYEVPGKIDDQEWYDELVEAMELMSFTEEEVDGMWSGVASSLQLSNITFDTTDYDKSNGKEYCKVKNKDQLELIAEMLGTTGDQLEKAMITKIRVIGKEVIESMQSGPKCGEARDALAKDVYNNLFSWLVKRMNFTTLPEEDMQPGADLAALAAKRLVVGLLDIFGFEFFDSNSLEQFCINYTNETLQ